MSQTLNAAIAVAGIDIGKNSFHIVDRGPVISSAMVVAIGEGMCSTRAATSSPPGLVPTQISAGDRTILDDHGAEGIAMTYGAPHLTMADRGDGCLLRGATQPIPH